VHGSDYHVAGSRIIFTDEIACQDTVDLVRYFESGLIGERYQLHEFVTTEKQIEPRPPPVTTAPRPQPTADFKIGGAKTFSADLSDRRAVSFSQGLGLTLSGDIGHGIIVKGSFSDRGLRDNRLVTRRFSELENVYLEVESQQLRGRFGNFELRRDEFEYLRLTRNVQGLELGYQGTNYRVETSLSIPPGSFATNSFEASESDYGPYQLKGNAGELGIAVIEYSESVWLNGRKLIRGRDQDYYLDYLRGELFFTGRMLIDDGDRVRVDFEYQKTEYRKTMATAIAGGQLLDDRISLYVGALSLTDAATDPLDFSLTDRDEQALATAGDDPDDAQVSGARFVGSGEGDYRLEIDSLQDTIYTYVGFGEGDYSVSFGEVSNGDYIYLGGGHYQYVGAGNGHYLPIRSLPLPQAVRLFGVKADLQLDEDLTLSTESAISLHDRNRLSNIGDGDNNTVAGKLGLEYADSSRVLSGRFSAELLPANFFRTSRLELVQEDYLWQRQQTGIGDRQRYLLSLNTKVPDRHRGNWEMGYTREVGGFSGWRLFNQSSLAVMPIADLSWELNLAGSDDRSTGGSLVRIAPTLESRGLPIQLGFRGEYDRRRTTSSDGQRSTASRRELGASIGYAGVAISVRQKENWQHIVSWRRLDRKRTLGLRAERQVGRRGRLSFVANLNDVDQLGRENQSYQSGALDLLLPSLGGLLYVDTRLRLSRRGQSQTNETFLKVEEGEGDYIQVDSVYIRDERGDYLRVIEQVGDLIQTVEAEKRVRLDFDLHRIGAGAATTGMSFRYEISLREIGNQETDFSARWLLPPPDYFDEPRFRQRRDQFRLRRHHRDIGLLSEIELERSTLDNRLELSRPSQRQDQHWRLLFHKEIRERDYAEARFELRESERSELARYHLSYDRQRLSFKYRYYLDFWELELETEFGRESSDSLNLELETYKLANEIAYRLPDIGRASLRFFTFIVGEEQDRLILVELADGFPVGTNFGGRVSVDFHLGRSFSIDVSARGEIRDGEDNRYFLKSELVSRFQ
jgi:hypothetical protein